MDVARIGSRNAPKVLLLISGTHGVEGYCGSGAQIGLLKSGSFDELPSDLSIVLIHALNPYGFSHDRRVNEDNIDLNRNFLEFGKAVRPQSDYSKIHQALVPSDWDGPIRDSADKRLEAFKETHGLSAYQAAVSSGQYDYPDGLFYGGRAPSWSNKMLQDVLAKHLPHVDNLAVIDFHTGLGPHGYGELISIGNQKQKDLSTKIYGDQVTDPDAGTSSSASLDGMIAQGIFQHLKEAQISFVTLEFGTYDVDTVLTALRGDNWLYQKANWDDPKADSIKANIRKAFYPDTDDWRANVWSRTQDVIELAFRGLKN